jgi:hypothetical protein
MLRIHGGLSFAAVIAAASLAAAPALAADAPATAKPKPLLLCNECGMVYNIRRIEKPVAPERDTLPSLTSSPQVGGIGSATQAVPLLSFGAGGPQRVQREPATRSVWEITVRYDNGQFGFVAQDGEPELKVGDRVRMFENVLEPIPQTPR